MTHEKCLCTFTQRVVGDGKLVVTITPMATATGAQEQGDLQEVGA